MATNEQQQYSGLAETVLQQQQGAQNTSGDATSSNPNDADATSQNAEGGDATALSVAPGLPEEEPVKRKRGRPRGSKTKPKPVDALDAVAPTVPASYARTRTTEHRPSFYARPPASGANAIQNQDYYEFQWRVLNLCSEFYAAAEDLLKTTSPLVISQCYQMGPHVPIDPHNMITEAKRVCDTLLANPSQLTTNPPQSAYPNYSQYPVQTPAFPQQTQAGSSNNYITQPPAAQHGYHVGVPQQHPQQSQSPYNMPPPPNMAGPYNTPYQYGNHPGYHHTGPTQPGASPLSVPGPGPGTPVGAGNQGAWAPDEVERLKHLTVQSKSTGTTGEIDWQWVVHQWGSSRTRHQILMKATALGLKETSAKSGDKRRREGDGDGSGVSSLVQQSGNVGHMNGSGVTEQGAGPDYSAYFNPQVR